MGFTGRIHFKDTCDANFSLTVFSWDRKLTIVKKTPKAQLPGKINYCTLTFSVSVCSFITSKCYFFSIFNKLQFTQNHRRVRVGNYLWRSSSPTLQLKQDRVSRHNFDIRREESSTSLAACSSTLSPSSKEAFPHTQIPPWQIQFHPHHWN